MKCLKKKKVSVIIPAYNAEDTIGPCLTSVQKQTYTNLQILLINDGSRDGTLEACREIAEKDPRITIISQENNGVSHARNRGIIEATGTFIQFVDADDKLDATMIEQLVKTYKQKTDLVICGYRIRKNQKERPIIPEISGVFTFTQFLTYVGQLFAHTLLQSPCNKLYRSDIIKKKALKFPEQLNLGEDLSFNIDYIQECRRVHIINKALYIYINREGSLSKGVSNTYFSEQKALINRVVQLLKSNHAFDSKNRRAIQNVFSQVIINSLSQLIERYEGDKTQILHELDKIFRQKDIIDHLPYFTKNKQAKLLRLFIKYDLKKMTYLFLKGKHLLRWYVKILRGASI